MSIKIQIVHSLEDLLKAFFVRNLVFCGGQKIPYAIEHDEHDFSATHILGECDGRPVAAGRVRFFADYAKLERIAVLDEYRGQSIGHQLTDFMIRTAQERGYQTIKLHAQAYLEKFYERHGFVTEGERFSEADIEHCLMIRRD